MVTNTKPGVKTTEFWVTILIQILSLLVVFGVITPEEQGNISTGVQQLVAGIVQLVSAVAYIWSRTKAKSV